MPAISIGGIGDMVDGAYVGQPNVGKSYLERFASGEIQDTSEGYEDVTILPTWCGGWRERRQGQGQEGGTGTGTSNNAWLWVVGIVAAVLLLGGKKK